MTDYWLATPGARTGHASPVERGFPVWLEGSVRQRISDRHMEIPPGDSRWLHCRSRCLRLYNAEPKVTVS